jgi:HAD superfamily hydrolase (TIGR01509 family)
MSIVKPPLAVLWDLDGTLVDSEKYWMLAESELALDHGYEWSDEDGLELVGMALFNSCALIQQKLKSSMSVEQIIDRLTADVQKKLSEEIIWRPGAKSLLQELRNAGVKTALVTMSMRRMALDVTENLGFDGFDVVVAGDDVSRGKPHPEGYLKAAELLGVLPHHCIALEDSEPGLTAAEAAGTLAIGIPAVKALAEKQNRLIWPTLQGVSLSDLQQLFEGNR